MALSGTLEELAVLDVVQFANQTHMSGALVLTSPASEEAHLFYRKGKLVHARLGDQSGLEVLVRIMDWGKGTFTFQAGAAVPAETIHRTFIGP